MTVRLIYSSAAEPGLASADLEQLLEESRVRNELHGITGVLILIEGTFLQILEGEEAAVADLMARIERDPRHSGLRVFHREQVGERAFASWSMAYLGPAAVELSRWAELPGTTTLGEVLASLERHPDRLPRMYRNILEALARQ